MVEGDVVADSEGGLLLDGDAVPVEEEVRDGDIVAVPESVGVTLAVAVDVPVLETVGETDGVTDGVRVAEFDLVKAVAGRAAEMRTTMANSSPILPPAARVARAAGLGTACPMMIKSEAAGDGARSRRGPQWRGCQLQTLLQRGPSRF